MRHIRRPSGFDLMCPEWPSFKDPLHQTLFPLSCYSASSPALIFLSLQSCFNHNIILKKKIRLQTNKVTSKSNKKWLKTRNTTERQAFSKETFSSILDCYFSISLSFTFCHLYSLHISSPGVEKHFLQICTFVGTSKEDFSNFHLYRKP